MSMLNSELGFEYNTQVVGMHVTNVRMYNILFRGLRKTSIWINMFNGHCGFWTGWCVLFITPLFVVSDQTLVMSYSTFTASSDKHIFPCPCIPVMFSLVWQVKEAKPAGESQRVQHPQSKDLYRDTGNCNSAPDAKCAAPLPQFST